MAPEQIKDDFLPGLNPANEKPGNQPALRFAGFTGDWERRKLGEIVKEVTRNDSTSEAPVMMITANSGFIEQSERYAFNNAGDSLKKYTLLRRGELAYNHGASKLRPYGSCFALTTVESARLPFVYHCFSVEGNEPEFISMELNGTDVENQLRRIVSSGARMDGLLNISFEEYTSIKVFLPQPSEQRKISAFFRSLDNLITLYQRKLEKLRNIKNACLEKMFPQNGSLYPEIRFPGFTDAWEQRKLEDFVDRASTMGADDDLPRVEYEDIISGTGKLNKDINTKVSNKLGLRFEAGDILYGKLRPYLKNWFLPTFCGLAVGDFWVLRPQKIDSQFLYSLIQSDQFNKVANQSAGTKMPRADWKLVSKTEFAIPLNIVEQQQIGVFFRSLDNLITLQQRKLEELRNIKKACLEKMFI